MMGGRLERDYFEKVYENSVDPWRFESSWYERRKQALTMALLPAERYHHIFEPGCASGEITRLLAGRADSVLAMDVVPKIVARAQQRLAECPGVEIRLGAIPEDWPKEKFDLILLSEVGYYLDADSLAIAAEKICESLVKGGHLVAVHYLGATDYPLHGDEVEQHLCNLLPDFDQLAKYREHDFAAFVLQR
jgi:SAM-dependent methyltransferase